MSEISQVYSIYSCVDKISFTFILFDTSLSPKRTYLESGALNRDETLKYGVTASTMSTNLKKKYQLKMVEYVLVPKKEEIINVRKCG